MTVALENASTSGVNSSLCNVYYTKLAHPNNAANSYVIIKNFASSTAQIKIICNILYSYDEGNSAFEAF